MPVPLYKQFKDIAFVKPDAQKIFGGDATWRLFSELGLRNYAHTKTPRLAVFAEVADVRAVSAATPVRTASAAVAARTKGRLASG